VALTATAAHYGRARRRDHPQTRNADPPSHGAAFVPGMRTKDAPRLPFHAKSRCDWLYYPFRFRCAALPRRDGSRRSKQSSAHGVMSRSKRQKRPRRRKRTNGGECSELKALGTMGGASRVSCLVRQQILPCFTALTTSFKTDSEPPKKHLLSP